MTTNNIPETWTKMITQFTDCHLTYETDRLPAISGLARRMKPIFNCRYLAGLWELYLVPQLLWASYSSSKSKRTATYQAPTWSWASRIGKVVCKFSGNLPDQCITVRSVEVRTKDNHEMSQVIYGCLRLTGTLIPSSLQLKKVRSSDTEMSLVMRARQCFFDFIPDASDEVDETFMSARYYCLPMERSPGELWVEGLVIKHSGRKGQYQRVGYFSCYTDFGIDSIGPLEGERFFGRGDDVERAMMTDDLYEEYEEEEDVYTLTII
jgi:hypothetical protein